MIPPFSVHTALEAQYQQFIGGGNANGLATLMFVHLSNLIVPCTHSEIMADFTLVPGGQSANTMVEHCEFRVSSMNGNIPKKGYKVTFQVNPNLPPLYMMLWHGGLQAGGEIYRFALVDVNYRG